MSYEWQLLFPFLERTDEITDRIALDESELLFSPPPPTLQKETLKPFDSTPYIKYVTKLYHRDTRKATLPHNTILNSKLLFEFGKHFLHFTVG